MVLNRRPQDSTVTIGASASLDDHAAVRTLTPILLMGPSELSLIKNRRIVLSGELCIGYFPFLLSVDGIPGYNTTRVVLAFIDSN